ncbi:hypothetical protein D9V34_06750 [Mycetocola lacteus]|uniref:YbaB/EbfC family DNA-binding protein n=1 Tax=Mycetocola lacteus TaxID=76637 RepID=A0A3L7ATR3_9MICO|nr:YbaB/EbfC family nucleoid-associated protein [Mycetocola lacteus]RLP82941.1 hypothetical protein D9V34_06750 [Mycetocola lacteus]
MSLEQDPIDEFEAARAELQAISAQADANAQGAAALADDARTLQASVRSPRGEVTVTARVGGAISAVQFADAALSLRPAELSRLVETTIAQAQFQAAQRFADRAAEAFGTDSEIAAQLRADALAAFPEPGPDTTGIRY